MEDDERHAVARREGPYGSRTPSSVLGFSCTERVSNNADTSRKEYSRGITSEEVIARLLRAELRDWRQHAVCVASAHNDILGCAVYVAQYPSIGNELNRVCAACVLRDGDIIVVGLAICYIDDVLGD